MSSRRYVVSAHRYVVRRNPDTGRWVVYARTGLRLRPARPVYAILGHGDTLTDALEGISRDSR